MYALEFNSLIKNPNIYLLRGVTPETIETCSRLLQLNYEQHHIYFNTQRGFHNHIPDHLLAALSLGASSQTLERIYDDQKKLQLPRRPLHDKKEFDAKKCIGDDSYYPDYIEFFTKELENEKYHGKIEELIEDYVFNKDYLPLILHGFFHPFIHLGYALEFQLKAMVIQGLAMAAIDRASVTDVFKHLKYDPHDDGNKTALDIIGLMKKDQRFDEKISYKDERPRMFKFLERGGGELVAEYAQMWKCDLNDLRRISILMNTAVIRPKKPLRLNFFLMHVTTSSIFLEIFVRSLKSEKNQLKFLRAKFAIDLLMYVVFGRPKLNLDYLINGYQPSKEHSYSDAKNPWLPLIDKCLTHHDEHVTKTIRALVYAEKFDSAKGKQKLPYLKMAQVTMDALFPAATNGWDHDGVGWEEYWETLEDL